MKRSDPAATPPRRIFGVLSSDQERTIRFLVGIGIMIREMEFMAGDPRPLVLVVGATLSGTSLTSIADEIRRFTRKDDQ